MFHQNYLNYYYGRKLLAVSLAIVLLFDLLAFVIVVDSGT